MKTEKKVMRILEQAYESKTNCFPKTRYRAITWGGPPCYWLQFPNWLYNCWGIFVIAGMDLFSGNMRDQVNSFMSTVMQEEPLDASLMVMDDGDGW